MEHDYTLYPIIPFIYNELDLFARLEFEFALEEDSRLLESYYELMSGYNFLPKVTFSPSKSTLDKVLAYSTSGV
ncbi:MAG: hypothetical protein IPL63_15405 [Saprospiraceae bacterium]|nr:hypothetical protein [Saprospiraceae bacterium]